LVVLHLIARFNIGGTAKYLLEIANNLPKHGVRIVIATGNVQGSEIEDQAILTVPHIRIKNLGRKINPIQDFLAMREFQQIVIDLKPDVIHTHTFKAGFIARIQRDNLEEKLGYKVKFIHTFHGHLFDDPEFSKFKKNCISKIEKYLSKKTDIIITVGHNVKKELNSKGIRGKNNTISIPPAVNKLKLISKSAAYKKFKINDKKILRVLWLARVTGVKNPYKVIEIAKYLPNVDFFMAGGGDQQEYISKNAPKNLKVLGWQKASEVMPIADIFLSTSENEGMPIAIIEAQLAGIPAVVTDVGSVSEVVKNMKTGIVCKKDTKSLINAILKLSKSKRMRNLYGKRAKDNAKQEFSLDKFISAHKKLYLK
jgi:glycosyltransferase involved in cell wall biosynthesis